MSLAFRRPMRLQLILGMAFTLGCAGASDADDPPLDREGYDLDVCAAGASGALDLITPSVEVDYLELAVSDGSMHRRGVLCSGATDAAACESAFYAQLPPLGWGTRPGGGAPGPRAYLRYTRGDEVGTVGAPELGAFLAPTDSLADAAFIAEAATAGEVDCSAPAARVVAGGTEIIVVIQYSCGGATEERRVLVAPDGTATVLESAFVNRGIEEVCP